MVYTEKCRLTTIEEFAEFLANIRVECGEKFSGIGILVSDTPARLPIVSLRDTVPDLTGKSALQTLAEISVTDGTYHDGFHVVSPAGLVTRVSQYFSPPIDSSLGVDRHKVSGGRYMAALYGSVIQGIIMTGISTRQAGIRIFVGGREVFCRRVNC